MSRKNLCISMGYYPFDDDFYVPHQWQPSLTIDNLIQIKTLILSKHSELSISYQIPMKSEFSLFHEICQPKF